MEQVTQEEDMKQPAIDYKAKYLMLSEQYCRDTAKLQAQIDSLMLEYCPYEMTEDQIQTWKENQR